MPAKNPFKPRRVVKRRGRSLRNIGGFKGTKKKPTKQLSDTSRIPWFPPLPKTGTDA